MRTRSRSAAPGWQGATTANTGSIQGRNNATSRDAPPARWSLFSEDRPLKERQAGGGGEMTEVAIARDERRRLIEAALGDQRIGDARLPLLFQHGRAQQTGTLPVPRFDVQDRQPAQQRANRTRQCRVAQQL